VQMPPFLPLALEHVPPQTLLVRHSAPRSGFNHEALVSFSCRGPLCDGVAFAVILFSPAIHRYPSERGVRLVL